MKTVPASVTIRPATSEDAAEIANVHISSWREAYKGLLPQEFLDKRPLHFKNRYELWKKVTRQQGQNTFVAESADHGVVGFVNGAKARDEAYEGYSEVWCIYLLEHYHGQGIGYSLLKTYFDHEAQAGFERGYLWVLDGNPSVKFYQRCGARLADDVKMDTIADQRVKELCYVWDQIRLGG